MPNLNVIGQQILAVLGDAVAFSAAVGILVGILALIVYHLPRVMKN